MYDPYDSPRAQRRYYRDQRRYYRYRNPMRGLASGLFLIALIIGFTIDHDFSGIGFLSMLFIGLAFLALFGSLSSMNRHGIYGGLHGFIWMLGLALCFWIGFWPWILLPIAVTMILGALFNPITAGLAGAGFLAASQMQQQQPYQQSYPPQEQPNYQPYQQGYQATPPQTPGNQQYQYNQEPKQEYEQPQVQYPDQQQELPPMQQQ